jgi:hypothetical protein
MSLIFAFAGRRQVGKDSCYKIICDLLPGKKIRRIALADPVKYFCQDYFRVPEKRLWGSNFEKEKWIGKAIDFFDSHVCKEFDLDPDEPIGSRQLLQFVGTEIFRKKIKNNFWIDLCIKRIQKSQADIICITDVRFENELEAIKNIGGKTIKLYRRTGLKEMEHDSESQIDTVPDTEFDYIIPKEKNTNLKKLRKVLFSILTKEGLIINMGTLI